MKKNLLWLREIPRQGRIPFLAAKSQPAGQNLRSAVHSVIFERWSPTSADPCWINLGKVRYLQTQNLILKSWCWNFHFSHPISNQIYIVKKSTQNINNTMCHIMWCRAIYFICFLYVFAKSQGKQLFLERDLIFSNPGKKQRSNFPEAKKKILEAKHSFCSGPLGGWLKVCITKKAFPCHWKKGWSSLWNVDRFRPL